MDYKNYNSRNEASGCERCRGCRHIDADKSTYPCSACARSKADMFEGESEEYSCQSSNTIPGDGPLEIIAMDESKTSCGFFTEDAVDEAIAALEKDAPGLEFVVNQPIKLNVAFLPGSGRHVIVIPGAMADGPPIIDAGEVDVKTPFVTSLFDEDDGWLDITVPRGRYKWRMLDVNGWKPRQILIGDKWIDVCGGCEELEEMLDRKNLN